MVRLITHNLLACHAKGCTTNNFPLQFQDAAVELREAEFNADFLRGFLPRLEWPALVGAARQVRFHPVCFAQDLAADTGGAARVQLGDTSLPAEQPEMVDDEFLQKLHHVLLEVRPICSRNAGDRSPGLSVRQMHVEEGAMVCQNCKHVYPISNGIPNMVRLLSPSPVKLRACILISRM